MRYRLKFSKQEKMKYIGHLDLLKVFQRTVKRSGLPVSYSKGFNPHQLMSFASPLPLGMTSVSEFVDIQFEDEIEDKTITGRLNAEMPAGLEVITARKLNDTDKNCAASLCAANYGIILNEKIDKSFIDDIIKSDELMFEKKTKMVNIRPDIHRILYVSDTAIELMTAAGSAKNLKPEHVIEYIYNRFDRQFLKYKIKFNRLEMFQEDNGKYISL